VSDPDVDRRAGRDVAGLARLLLLVRAEQPGERKFVLEHSRQSTRISATRWKLMPVSVTSVTRQ